MSPTLLIGFVGGEVGMGRGSRYNKVYARHLVYNFLGKNTLYTPEKLSK